MLAPGSVGKYHGLGRLLWSSGDWSFSAGGIVDLETGAFIATADTEVFMPGDSSLRLAATIPASENLLGADELGLSGRGWTALASISVRF